MKTNNKKKIVVSVLALAMGAGLAGSISGSVAWYQYSTRTSVAVVGTTAGTSRNLWVAQYKGPDGVYSDSDWKQHIPLTTSENPVKFRPASVYGTAGHLNFVEHPVYKSKVLPAAASVDNETAVYKVEYNLVFKCVDSVGATKTQIDKEVYLTELNIEDVNTGTETEQNHKDITPAVRIEIDGAGTSQTLANDFIIGKTVSPATTGTTTTHGNLNLNGNKDGNNHDILDKDGYDTNDEKGALIDYINYERTVDDPETLGLSYDFVSPSTILATTSGTNVSAYSFGNKENHKLTSTKTGEAVSDPVKITVWIEGWQALDGSSLWDSKWLEQNFELQFQFACEADRY